jgi:hypothetical protein
MTCGRGVWWGQALSIFVGDVEPMNIWAYIRRFHITDEYTIIFLSTEEYNVLYTLALRSSAILSVSRGVYPKFLSFIGKFLSYNRRMYHSFL